MAVAVDTASLFMAALKYQTNANSPIKSPKNKNPLPKRSRIIVGLEDTNRLMTAVRPKPSIIQL